MNTHIPAKPLGEAVLADLERRLIKVVARQLRIEEGSISRDSSFIGDLRADSLARVEIIMALEDEFDVDIPDQDAEGMVTVQEATEYVTRALDSRAS
jgi:acyl carrier protein